MKPEEVLNLIGFPDFVGREDTWQYDIDVTPAQTLIVKWTDRRTSPVEKMVPALWQKDLVRDEQFAYQQRRAGESRFHRWQIDAQSAVPR